MAIAAEPTEFENESRDQSHTAAMSCALDQGHANDSAEYAINLRSEAICCRDLCVTLGAIPIQLAAGNNHGSEGWTDETAAIVAYQLAYPVHLSAYADANHADQLWSEGNYADSTFFYLISTGPFGTASGNYNVATALFQDATCHYYGAWVEFDTLFQQLSM